MMTGTKSLMFGVHQVLIHPWFVAAAWVREYGWPSELPIWISFFTHDLGYFGCAKMDDADGERHVELGAEILHRLFDRPMKNCPIGRDCKTCWRWYDFSLYHSRFYARNAGMPPSRLCIADKLAIAMYPRWLYLLLANLSGEIDEYMDERVEKYREFLRDIGSDQWHWITKLQAYVRDWVEENRHAAKD